MKLLLGRPAFTLLAAAVLLMAPSLVLGTLPSHSSPQNLTYAEQFAEQFRNGVLYPRWLADSFDGLGSPAFYFYPPGAFWVDALLNLATFGTLSTSYCLSFSSLLLLWASGLAMHTWLRAEKTSPQTAVFGALAYMVAPYHLLDHYYRGAYAEFGAYAVLPVVMLAIGQIADKRRPGPALLAVAYAALPIMHLPTSLLISLTALPMYVLYRGWRLGVAGRAAAFFARCALGGVLGLGLAAVYLIPALTLQDWIPADTLWQGYYQIDYWFLLTPQRWPQPTDMMQIITWIAAAYGIAAIGVLMVLARPGLRRGWVTEPAAWAFICIICLLLIAGVLPSFWKLPFVAKVQFPWRLMIVVEFAGITALCLMPWPVPSRALSYVFVIAIITVVPGIGAIVPGVILRMQVALAQHEVPSDLSTFEPAGFPQKEDGKYADLFLEPLEGVPPIACTPVARVCSVSTSSFDRLRVDLDADAPTKIVLRRFYYPLWRLDPILPVIATDPLRLVSFTAPAGRYTYNLRRVMVPAEKWGWAISGLSLVLLMTCLAMQRYRRRM
ncbi:MAG: hypothetical protein J0H44_12790 [Alphaproteobacteria bacterium]|nr:hypothetical protein [Alphaproteobacteria bacterium]